VSNITSIFRVKNLLWLSLALALGASMSHLAFTFNQFEQSGRWHIGWLAAVATDVGMMALAYAIHIRKRQRRSAKALWLALAFFTLTSIVGNVYHGTTIKTGTELALASFATIDMLRLATMLLLSAAPPVMVFALAEIVGDDATFAQAQEERERQRAERKAQRERQEGASIAKVDEEAGTLAQANVARQAQAEQAVSALLAFYAANPGATQAEAGAAVGRSRQWVSAQLAQLEEAGVVSRNGEGVKVLEME
jgi:hypothetical protein